MSVSAAPDWRRRFAVAVLVILSVLPVVYVGSEAVSASRNFPFFDEIDSAVDFVLKLGSTEHWRDAAGQFFALSNEHRMLTSRAMFAACYWLTGTLNFHVIGALGNLFIVAACLLLIGSAKFLEARVRMGVVLAFLIFQLEHYENFIWSGASIDHFQVVMLAVASIVLLTRGTSASTLGAGTCAALATFTLVHGALVWPLGAASLAHQRRWKPLLGWCVGAAIVLSGFFWGFAFNPGHHVELTLGTVPEVMYFWLQLIGAPLLLGNRAAGAVPGFLLLVALGLLVRRGALNRHPVQILVACFGAGSLILVAVGRLHIDEHAIASRYLILGALSWAMLIHVLLEETATQQHPFRWLAWMLPALVAFDVTAAFMFQVPKEAFIEVRDRAATYYQQYGRAGTGISRMHPDPARAEQVLAAAGACGVFRLPNVSPQVHLEDPRPSTRIITHVDELVVGERAVTIGGWAMVRGETSKRGHVFVVLKSENGFRTYRALTLQRPDVARAYREPRWRLCGFRAVLARDQLPSGNFHVGVVVDEPGGPEYVMTEDVLSLSPRSKAHERLATQP